VKQLVLVDRPFRTALIFFAAVVLLALPQAALLPLLDRDEPRFAEASREMIQSGNYVIPTFNGQPRYAKPPLIYWCQAACFRVFGENAFAARLPSLLATAGTAVLLLAWGRALGSFELGAIAALSYAFCFQTIQQGRVATADALLVFFMTLTVYAGWRLIPLAVPTGRKAAWRFWGIVLTLALAGGLLAKGPEALLAILPLFWCLRKNGWRVFFALKAIGSLALLLFACWGVPALVQSHGDYFRVGIGEDVVHRSVSGMQGHGASTFGWYLLLLPFYFVWFWLSALPWSPLLITRRRQLFGGWKPDETDVYLLLNIALVFLVFTLMVTKLPHYTLPAFPLIALLFARRWVTTRCTPSLRPAQLGWWSGFALAVVALVGIPIAMYNGLNPSPVGSLVRQAGWDLTPETKVAIIGFEEPNAIWETRRVVQVFPSQIPAEKLDDFLEEVGPHAIIMDEATFNRFPHVLDERWKFEKARGLNTARLRRADLEMVIKPGW